MGGNQAGNQNNAGSAPGQSGNKRKRMNDGLQQQQQDRQQQQQQQQQQQSQQQYANQPQSSLFSSDPNLQSRYAGLAGTGYRATPGVSSSLQPTLGDAIPQPVASNQQQQQQSSTSPNANNTLGNGSDFDSPNRPQVGSEEWHKQRRDNHKEVERRRRETINDGISELAKIVPGC